MSDAHKELEQALQGTQSALDRVLETHRPAVKVEEIGTVTSVGRGISRASGLAGVKAEELVRFETGLLGIAFNLDETELGIILLGDNAGLQAGHSVYRTGRVADVPVGEGLLGRVLDPAGRPLDERGPLRTTERLPVERDAAGIIDRAPVTVPMQTGIKLVDALIPVGRGQRELILGDRQTGKTAIALDTIINQRGKDVVCVYCAIGRRDAASANLIADLHRHDAMEYSVVMVASGASAPGLQYIAPYAATSVAEHFMERGRDVLIIYDDLTRHAQAYRELSLLLRRPPGREAYPGDIFYLHSRLLERSTQLNQERGGGSLTALPIVETEAQNISAYIPTNLISITDGQIVLSSVLFGKGLLPAVDVGRSVSRVGGKAQLPAYRAVAGDLRLSYAQFEELEVFARFGTRLEPETRRQLDRGERVREVLKQSQYEPMPAAEQIAVLLAVTEGLFDGLPLEQIEQAQAEVRQAVRQELTELSERIEAGEPLRDEGRAEMRDAAARAIEQMKSRQHADD